MKEKNKIPVLLNPSTESVIAELDKCRARNREHIAANKRLNQDAELSFKIIMENKATISQLKKELVKLKETKVPASC